MVTVKIECPCGQHYAFDVEPADGRMSSTVACPVCGADGTATANEVLASTLRVPLAAAPVAPPAEPPGGSRIKLSGSGHPVSLPAGVKVDARTLGLVSRESAETEARAKISWGDSKDEVARYLMLQGFEAQEATDLVALIYKERLATLRKKGIGKIVQGFGMMCLPVIAWSCHLAVISLKLMGLALGVGGWGFFILINGVIIVVAPKMESGDVAE